MSDNPRPRLLAGVQLVGVDFRALETHRDRRGAFTEVFQQHWRTCLDPVQWSVVHSIAGVLRGMHLHRRHDEYFALLEGRALIGLHDLRPDSPTAGQSSLFEMTGAHLACVAFPRGILHGWYFPDPSFHLQAVSEAFLDYGDDDNHGCHWADPDLGIPWPQKTVILSERAAGFPSLRELTSRLSASPFPAAGVSSA